MDIAHLTSCYFLVIALSFALTAIIFSHLLMAKSSHISENIAAAVLWLLLVRPVVGHITVLSLLELHMVLGLTHNLQFGYS